MAQWLGQFSGMTHLSKIQASAELLSHAVAILRGLEAGPTRERKAKAVQRLAKGLFRARLQWCKAQLAATTDAQAGASLAERLASIDQCQRKLNEVRAGGLAAILMEFDVPE